MKKIDFEKLINEILKEYGFEYEVLIGLLIDQKAKKRYDKKYRFDFDDITENTTYCVCYDGFIQFDIKVGKIDNLLKSFLTQFSAKVKIYKGLDNNGETTWFSKKEIFNGIVEKNANRVYSGLFYTTLYGIGFWRIFCLKVDSERNDKLYNFLKAKKIPFTNELSDANWVLRYKIGNDINKNNFLLNEFRKINKE